MAMVQHTCDVVYGSYSGRVTVTCDEEDGIAIVKAKIRKENSLNFLAMATYQVKIIKTERLL